MGNVSPNPGYRQLGLVAFALFTSLGIIATFSWSKPVIQQSLQYVDIQQLDEQKEVVSAKCFCQDLCLPEKKVERKSNYMQHTNKEVNDQDNVVSSKSLLQDIYSPKDERSASKMLPTTSKVILVPPRMNGVLANSNFKGCQSSNCIFHFSDKLAEASTADVVVAEYHSRLVKQISALPSKANQTVLVLGHESPAYSFNRWISAINNFDGTLTYSCSSSIYFPIGITACLQASDTSRNSSHKNYAVSKTKGAYAYVSYCNTVHYDRLQVMRQLSKYIDVDIWGKCTGKAPCARGDWECEGRTHAEHKFYLAFENSLCKDYVTEKFWKTLQSDGHFIPVVIGGLSIEDYSSIAPPDSFIHAYNFTSIAELGKYLSYLMEDDTAYNRYHQWKQHYKIIGPQHRVACDLCKLADNPSILKSQKSQKFADVWNDPKNCRKLNL